MNKTISDILRGLTPLMLAIIGFFCVQTYYDLQETKKTTQLIQIRMENVDTRLMGIERTIFATGAQAKAPVNEVVR